MQKSFWQNAMQSWEGLLVVILVIVIIVNSQLSPFYLSADNIANVFHLSIEKALVVFIMAFIIINGEIDLSVASVMGLAASTLAYTYESNMSLGTGIAIALAVGIICGALNGLIIAYLELPSLVVTLAGLIAYRGGARILLEDRSVGDFPKWFTEVGQAGVIGDFPITVFILLGLFIVSAVVLHYTAFGRYVFIIGNNKEAAEYAGIRVKRTKFMIFVASGLISAFAGLMYAARLGNIRANAAEGFELDIITMVLLGGVSIFGGKGSMVGVGLSLLVVLNLRNGMLLKNVDGSTQTSIVGALLILSVLIPNWLQSFQQWRARQTFGDGLVLEQNMPTVISDVDG